LIWHWVTDSEGDFARSQMPTAARPRHLLVAHRRHWHRHGATAAGAGRGGSDGSPRGSGGTGGRPVGLRLLSVIIGLTDP
jgi:hypothetical protein